MSRIEMRCRRQAGCEEVEIIVLSIAQNGVIRYAELPVLRELGKDEVILSPTITLRNDEAQMLIDELWRCGLRPREDSGSAGDLAATKQHLTDMRNIAFTLLNANKTGAI